MKLRMLMAAVSLIASAAVADTEIPIATPSPSQMSNPDWMRVNIPQLVGPVADIQDNRLLVGDVGISIDAQTRFSSKAGLSLTLQSLKEGEMVMVFTRTGAAGPVADRVVVLR